MSWLGSTLKSIDTRKELVNYIGGNTQPSRAVVTNNGGEIDSSVVTLAELALLSGISSNVQTQLTGLGDDKQDEITGAATSVTSANLTSDRVLLSDGAGKIIVSDVTATTLAYLDPTSSIQGQINSKQSEITASAPLAQSKIDGLTDTLSGKQPTIGSSTNLVVNNVTFGSGVDAILFNGVVPTTTSVTSGSADAVTSGAVYTALSGYLPASINAQNAAVVAGDFRCGGGTNGAGVVVAAQLRLFSDADTNLIGTNTSQLKIRGANTNGIGFYGSTGTLGSETRHN